MDKEVFRVASKRKRGGLNIYTIEDLNSEAIGGTFYQPELQKVTIDLSGAFNIEKVLRTRRRGGVKEMLVKWESYPASFNSWVKETDFVEAT